MKTVSRNTQTEGQEFKAFLGTINLKDCLSLTHVFPNDPDTWYETGTITHTWKEYKVELFVRAEFEVTTFSDEASDEMVWLEVEDVFVSKGDHDFDQDEIFGLDYDEVLDAIKNPYDSKPKEEEYLGSLTLSVNAKSKKAADAIVTKVRDLIKESDIDVCTVFDDKMETRQEIRERLIG